MFDSDDKDRWDYNKNIKPKQLHFPTFHAADTYMLEAIFRYKLYEAKQKTDSPSECTQVSRTTKTSLMFTFVPLREKVRETL